MIFKKISGFAGEFGAQDSIFVLCYGYDSSLLPVSTSIFAPTNNAYPVGDRRDSKNITLS